MHDYAVPSNAVCVPVHESMPAICPRDDYSAWLGEIEATPEQLKAMLKPCLLLPERVPILIQVGNVKNDGPELIERISV